VTAQQQLADAKAVCVEGMPWPGWSGVYVAAGENDGWPRFESDEGKHLGYSKHWGKWVLARAFDPAGRRRQAYAASPPESEDGELLFGTNDWMVYERRWNATTLALMKLCDEAEVTKETDRLAAEATAKRAAAKAAAQQQLKGKVVGVEGVPPEISQELNGVYIAAEGNDGWPQFKNAEGHHLCYSSEYFNWVLTDTVGSTARVFFLDAPFSSIDGLLPIGDRKLLTWTLTVSLLTAEEALQRQTRRLQDSHRARKDAAVTQMFAMFDADCDGKLDKGEYQSYLEGIGTISSRKKIKKIKFWGTCDCTDEMYDTTGWPKECKNLECCADEGVTAEAVRSILYEKHRVSDSQADLDSCKEWTAMSELDRQRHRDKRCLQPTTMQNLMHTCDSCHGKIPLGASILRCKRCDYDLCESCAG